jgi:hypothetical protein
MLLRCQRATCKYFVYVRVVDVADMRQGSWDIVNRDVSLFWYARTSATSMYMYVHLRPPRHFHSQQSP